MTGRADYLELGDWNAVCYQCGFKRKAHMLVRNWQGYYVCPEHNEPRQAQDFVRSVPDVHTPPWAQPRPDAAFRTGYVTVERGTAAATIQASDVGSSGAVIVSVGPPGGTIAAVPVVLTIDSAVTGTVLVNTFVPTTVTNNSTATVTTRSF